MKPYNADFNTSLWDFPLFPPEASTSAGRVDLLFAALVALSGLIVFGIGATMLWYVIRYRAGTQADRSNRIQNTWIYEAVFLTIPTLLMLGIFIWAAGIFFHLSRPPSNARIVYVVAKQWMWKIQHPEGRREINELHVPTGIPIRLVMTSQDVIHSFYVPAFRVKQDVLPNQYTTLWFQATQPGRYHLFCAEYCGTNHSAMQGSIVVMTPRDYEEWLDAGPPDERIRPDAPGQPKAPLALKGKGPFFALGCNACHLPTSFVRAPRLDGLIGNEVLLQNDRTVIADEQYLRESILDPNAKIVAGYESPSLMPTFKGQISEEQLRQLIEFIRSLQNGWPSEEETP